MKNDITVYYPLYTGKKYVPTAYSFVGMLDSFSDARDLFDFIKRCSLTKAGCEKICNRLNGGK